MKSRDFADLVLLAAIWGASFLFMRIAAPSFGAVALVEVRMLVGGLFLLPLLAMRGGLAWMDLECGERFGKSFVDSSAEQKANLLDLLAWPDTAPQELSQGVAFFTSFRDLTATGFFTSRMGFEDLRYIGNEFVTEWKGCPEAALRKLGLE